MQVRPGTLALRLATLTTGIAVVSGATAGLGGCARPNVEVVITSPATPAEGEGEGEGEGEAGEGEGEGEGEPGDDVIAVSHPRELRGAWLATVYGINWPSNSNASAAVKEQELKDLIDVAADAGLNALFFQVRPESDAMYASSLEPWSRFLTGRQGQHPGFDPLAVAVSHAHSRGVELHAWMNPYRGLTSTSVTAASNHITHTLADDAIAYDGMLWMDPSSTEVRAHVVAVVEDIVDHYDVDGIHFDDYFYPYPSGTEFPDASRFTAYQQAGGTMVKGDWRRDNVNALIRDVSEAIAVRRPSVRFGVSPFGIYKNGVPSGITGLDAYSAISCDPVAWIDNDWVDYLAPQLYWPTTQTRQAFGTLLPWWASLPDGDGRFVVAGLNLAAIDPAGSFTVDEYQAEIEITRAHGLDAAGGAGGTILYHLDPLTSDVAGVATRLQGLYAEPALPPPVVQDARIPRTPAVGVDVEVVGDTLTFAAPAGADRGYVVYSLGDAGADDAVVVDVVSGGGTRTLPGGRYAVTVVGKNDREGLGRLVEIR